MAQLQCLKQSLLAGIFHSSMPHIQLCIPDIVVILYNANLRFIDTAGHFFHSRKLSMNILNLPYAAVVSAGII